MGLSAGEVGRCLPDIGCQPKPEAPGAGTPPLPARDPGSPPRAALTSRELTDKVVTFSFLVPVPVLGPGWAAGSLGSPRLGLSLIHI